MNRLPVVVAALALVALVGGFIAYRSVGTGAPAFTVNGHTVSQSDIDSELRALADNAAFKRAIQQTGSQPLVAHPGTIDAAYTAGWLTLRITQVFIDDTVAHRHLSVTSSDRLNAEALAASLFGSSAVLRTLPASFRGTMLGRLARVAALQDDDLVHQTSRLQADALRACPSHRFVAHILVSSASDAQAIAAQLAAGADFATLADEHSIDRASGVRGGELGCLDSQQFVSGFEQVAQLQPVGQVSAPVQTQYGFHLILVRDQPQPADLQSIALNAVLGAARGAQVTVDPRYGRWDARAGRVVAPATASTIAPAPTP